MARGPEPCGDVPCSFRWRSPALLLWAGCSALLTQAAKQVPLVVSGCSYQLRSLPGPCQCSVFAFYADPQEERSEDAECARIADEPKD